MQKRKTKLLISFWDRYLLTLLFMFLRNICDLCLIFFLHWSLKKFARSLKQVNCCDRIYMSRWFMWRSMSNIRRIFWRVVNGRVDMLEKYLRNYIIVYLYVLCWRWACTYILSFTSFFFLDCIQKEDLYCLRFITLNLQNLQTKIQIVIEHTLTQMVRISYFKIKMELNSIEAIKMRYLF